MFSRFTRLPLRRSLHTASNTARAAPRFNRTAKLVLGTSAAAAALLSWNLSSESNRVHLDSAEPLSKKPVTPSPTSPPSSIPPSSEPESSEPFLPDAPADEAETAPSAKATEGEEEVEPQAAGEAAPQTQGAYNPETGEINWDCPCLGGMAHGPCGEQFKEAFSCFIFSEDEPKGINCVDAFKRMQDCFREHPEVYADEIGDDDEPATGSTPSTDATEAPSRSGEDSESIPDIPSSAVSEPQTEHETTSNPTPSSQ